MIRRTLFILICLPWSVLIAQDAMPAGAAGVESSGDLPVMFDGAVQFRWRVIGDEAATARLQSRTRAVEVSADGVATGFRLAVPNGAAFELAGEPAFIPEPLPGFGAAYGNVWPIAVDADGQRSLEGGAAEFSGRWVGIRNRFHAVMLTDIAAGQVIVDIERENEPRILIVPAPGESSISFRLYAGPVERAALRAADPVLTKMLFAALWDWLRWLCFGMLWLLTTIDGFVGNIGLSIILLSVAVKILMMPLTKTADRLQASVNQTAALLQPELAAIKRAYK